MGADHILKDHTSVFVYLVEVVHIKKSLQAQFAWLSVTVCSAVKVNVLFMFVMTKAEDGELKTGYSNCWK